MVSATERLKPKRRTAMIARARDRQANQLAHAGFARRCAHFVVTMAMPAFAHRSISRAARGASRDLISLRGVEADEPSFIGSVDTISNAQREEWLDRLRLLGVRGA